MSTPLRQLVEAVERKAAQPCDFSQGNAVRRDHDDHCSHCFASSLLAALRSWRPSEDAELVEKWARELKRKQDEYLGVSGPMFAWEQYEEQGREELRGEARGVLRLLDEELKP